MRTSGLALAIAVSIALTACFSTARYDTAHAGRVADINARYDAESRRLDAVRAERLAALDDLRASSRNQAVQHAVDEEAAAIEHDHAQALARLARARQDEIRASTHRRDAEVAAGRAARRARVKAAASAYPAVDRTVHAPGHTASAQRPVDAQTPDAPLAPLDEVVPIGPVTPIAP